MSSNNNTSDLNNMNMIINNNMNSTNTSNFDEIKVANNNININEIINNLKFRKTTSSIKTPNQYLFQEFLTLAKESKDVLLSQKQMANTFRQNTS